MCSAPTDQMLCVRRAHTLIIYRRVREGGELLCLFRPLRHPARCPFDRFVPVCRLTYRTVEIASHQVLLEYLRRTCRPTSRSKLSLIISNTFPKFDLSLVRPLDVSRHRILYAYTDMHCFFVKLYAINIPIIM